jgi:hypothetical protein
MNNKKANWLADKSLWALTLSNIFSIYFAVTEGWSLPTVMLVYWFQNVVIGIFNFVRILQLKEFSTENFKINGRPAQPTQDTKIFTAFFFLFHYGFFHLIYLMFIMTFPFSMSGRPIADPITFKYAIGMGLVFLGNHFFSYIYNKPRDTKKQNIGYLMFYPYARIIPMHLTIVLGGFYSGAIFLFMILKALADAAMHILEHNVIRKGEDQQYSGNSPF